ncbi:MAG: hypothetical protein MUP58_02560, partial [Candidatus Nanohaloarchaeota archaeon QJJ-9]|nr:hypothetical protein [Candidatus Nanohaloarchaeota archaeon QJJ-9]
MTTEFGSGLSKDTSTRKAVKKASEKALNSIESEKADFAVVFCSPEYELEELVETVKEETGVEKLTGATTAGEFTENGLEEGSVVISVIKSDDMKFYTGMGHNISDNAEKAAREAAESLPKKVDGYPHMAGINLHDTLSGFGETVSQFAYLETGISMSGGAAGDNWKFQETWVFTEDEIDSDAIALTAIASKKPFSFSVGHGHEPISPELEVTEASGSTVYELNGRPALEVWAEYVADEREESPEEILEDEKLLKNLLIQHELGVDIGGMYKVRTGALTAAVHGTEGPMEFSVQIADGTKLRVMTTSKEKEIESPRNVARQAAENM